MDNQKTTDFLTWAKAQAKQHGADSKISDFSRLTSKYTFKGLLTWGDVVKAGEADLRDQGRKPDALLKIKIKTSKDYDFQANQLATIAEHQQNAIDRVDTGSQDYADGLTRLKETKAALATAKTERDKLATQEKATADAAKTATNTAKTVKTAQSDLKDLQDQKKRAADIGGDTSALDTQIASVQDKLANTTSPAAKPFTTPMTISGQSTQVQPTVTPTKTTSTTPDKPASIPVNSTWDGKKWVAPKVTPPLSQEDFLTKYGTTLAFINSDPSLKTLFTQASKGNWSGQDFTARLKQTDWAKKYAANAQAGELSRTQSPSTWVDSFNRMRAHIAQVAVNMGEAVRPQDIGTETAIANANRQDGTITQWAIDHAGDTNFEDALQKHIATIGQVNLALPGGTAASDMMKLKAYAGQMGLGYLALPGGQDYFSNAAQSNLLGTTTIDTQQAQLLKMAKDKYQAFAPSLDAGQTVHALAAPYINTLANLLEIAPDQIDLSSSTGYGKMVNDALTGIDPANQKPMALYDFEKQVKSRPEWGKTNNARDTIMGGVGSLLASLGKVSP